MRDGCPLFGGSAAANDTIVLMVDAVRYRCPGCDSTYLESIISKALENELLECQECRRIYAIVRASDGTTRLVPV